jgi:outer membrane protein insertion porin family
VAEIAVVSDTGEPILPTLLDSVYAAVSTEPGRTTTQSRLQEDINSVFATGYFSNVRALPEDTPLGVRITFVVTPNPILTQVQVRDNQVLPQSVVDDIFSPEYGQTLNLLNLQDGILAINDWYQENGYVLAQVTPARQVSDDGVVTLIASEGVIEEITIRYISADGQTEDEDGNPITGKTRDFIVTREMQSQPGDVFQEQTIQQDLQRVFGLGIFEDVRLSLDPGEEDPRKVNVVVNIAERNSGSIGAAVGFNLTGNIFGSVSYQQTNLGGNDQDLTAEVQLSTDDLLFDVSFTDPWIAGDPYRTSYTVNAFTNRAISLVFDNGPINVPTPDGNEVRILRRGGGVSFGRPLNNGWSASLGMNYQRVSSREPGGSLVPLDADGNPYTFSASKNPDQAFDDLITIPFSVVRDLRDNPLNATRGSLLRLGTEQTIPLGAGSILYNRLNAGYSYYIPVNLLGTGDFPETIALNFQAGTVLGDLPPYNAFVLGGVNSIRGWEEGSVADGRSYVQGTLEYRFPLFTSFLGGALFFDFGSALGTQSAVPGNPGETRGKPGSGFGYGPGVRINTPLGVLRIDYGFNNEGGSRIGFGIGERF